MINYEKYRIAVLGTGHIGKTLARSLASAGHSVKVANSRGPETIAPDVLETGAEAADAASAVQDAQVVILSIPMAKVADIAPLIRTLPSHVIVADTSNYHRWVLRWSGRKGVGSASPEPSTGEGLECNRFRFSRYKR